MLDNGKSNSLICHVEKMTNIPNTPNNSLYRTRYKLLLYLDMHQNMTAQGQVAVQCHSLLNSAHGNEWSALCQGQFTLKTRSTQVQNGHKVK